LKRAFAQRARKPENPDRNLFSIFDQGFTVPARLSQDGARAGVSNPLGVAAMQHPSGFRKFPRAIIFLDRAKA